MVNGTISLSGLRKNRIMFYNYLGTISTFTNFK